MKCSYPPCNNEAVAVETFPMEGGLTGHLCEEHAARTDVVLQRLANMSQAERFAYLDGLLDAQTGLTPTEKDALRDHLREKYKDPS